MKLSSLLNNQDAYEEISVNISEQDVKLYVKRKMSVADNEYLHNNVPSDVDTKSRKYIIAMLTHLMHCSVRLKDEDGKLVSIDVDEIKEECSDDELAEIINKINEVRGIDTTQYEDVDLDEVEKELKKK